MVVMSWLTRQEIQMVRPIAPSYAGSNGIFSTKFLSDMGQMMGDENRSGSELDCKAKSSQTRKSFDLGMIRTGLTCSTVLHLTQFLDSRASKISTRLNQGVKEECLKNTSG